MRVFEKNFEASIINTSENVMQVAISCRARVNLSKESSAGGLNVECLYDSEKVYGQFRKMFDECVKIGEKEQYTEKEISTVNDFFAFSVAMNTMAPRVSSVLKARNTVCNLVDAKGPSIINYYHMYAAGIESVIKPVAMIEMLTPEVKGIVISMPKLVADEIKRFISHMSKSSFESFEMGMAHLNEEESQRIAG